MERVILNNRLVNYNMFKHVVVDYKKVKITKRGIDYIVNIPEVRLISKKELIGIIINGLLIAGLSYSLLVLLIGIAPLAR